MGLRDFDSQSFYLEVNSESRDPRRDLSATRKALSSHLLRLLAVGGLFTGPVGIHADDVRRTLVVNGLPAGVAEHEYPSRVVAAELEALVRSRDYLAHLIRCQETRPACQPHHPELAYDRRLLGRLDACHAHLVCEQAELTARRAELLREARANSPFSCPPELQERIVSHEALQALAASRSAQDLLRVSRQCKEGRLLTEQLRPRIQRLADIERRGLEVEARQQEPCFKLFHPHL